MSDEPLDAEDLARLRELGQRFMRAVPHNNALGLELRAVAEGRAEIFLPYDARLVGNPETGVLHGGAISALMDATCGAAVFQALRRPMAIATLDLRIDYLKPATPGRGVLARAHCYKVTRHVAFVRGVAYHDSEDDPIATSAGTFMLGTRTQSRTEATS
jgi:uncharacterized protein (TIGR00369 family)